MTFARRRHAGSGSAASSRFGGVEIRQVSMSHQDAPATSTRASGRARRESLHAGAQRRLT